MDIGIVRRYCAYLEREARYALCGLRNVVRPPLAWPGRAPAGGWCAFFSPGMERIPHLSAFVGLPCRRLPALPGAEAFWPRWAGGCAAVAVWGLKDPGARAARFAARFNLPLLRLEDGFMRSLDLGARGAAPLSLTVDRGGVYYDASRPSDLENLLNSTGWETPELLERARRAMAEIARQGLSKYNHAPNAPALPQTGRKRVLLIDQTANDLSVSLGLADASTFAAMLEAALAGHPEADIYIKTHPDVLAGKKRGFLAGADAPPNCLSRVRVLAEDMNPLSLLAQVDEVYAVSSQMGFEALLLGKKVHCFGMPFYAGWGLTADRLRCPRRTARRTLDEVFAAAFLLYARYVNPATGRPCAPEDVIAVLAEQRRRNEANRGYHACLGFKRWKRPHARAFLQSTGGEAEFFHSGDGAVRAAARRGGRVVVWASRETFSLQEACGAAGTPLLRMEDGFLRSVGLGTAFYRPGSLVVDDLGIYYDPTRESRLEKILRETDFSPVELELAAKARQIILQRGITKYNVGDVSDLPDVPEGRAVILVPGQVEDDASVLRGGLGMQSNLQLLETVRQKRPEAFIIYKEHPDVASGARAGRVPECTALRLADRLARGCSMHALLGICSEVHTITSLTGFEAILRGVPVFAYGGPFYAGWGLTTDRLEFPRRKKLPSVEHLVAGALLRYAAYYDWNSRNFLDCISFMFNICGES